MKKPTQFAVIGFGATALFAATYFTVFAVMGVPLAETPAAEHVLGVKPGAVSPHQVVIIQPTPKPSARAASTQRAADVLGAFVLPASIQAETLRTLKSELFSQLEKVRTLRTSLAERERDLIDRADQQNARFDELMSLRSRLDDYFLELEARAEELSHGESTRDEQRSARLVDMSSYLVEGDATHAAALLGSMDPADASQILDVLEPERAGEILRSMSAEASRMVWEAGLAQVK
jgi:flagellar motility protein MotE (MotC chaperone)